MAASQVKVAVIGCGFWAKYQVAAWKQIGVDVVALCDADQDKLQKMAEHFHISKTYTDPAVMLREEKQISVVDIITNVDTHEKLIKLVAQSGKPIICQKPFSNEWSTSVELVRLCKNLGVKFFVHENFRFQQPIRRVKEVLDSGIIGSPFKSNISFCHNFPAWENQPMLARLEKFVLMDVGVHILDVARYLHGEVKNLTCHTKRVNPILKGEDVANVFMEMVDGVHCYSEMSFASILENPCFPQTLISVEGDKGSLVLGPNFVLTVTTKDSTRKEIITVPKYDWVDPAYEVAQASMVNIHQDFVNALTNNTTAETNGFDNLKTMQLVFSCYDSAASGQSINIKECLL